VKAIRLFAPNEPLRAADVPAPVPADDEIVVRVAAAGICHTDAHYRAGFTQLRLPLTLGHEIAGVVARKGARVDGLAEGDRVALHYLRFCGTCRRCVEHGEQFCETGGMLGNNYDGGYAKEVVVPAANAVRIPENVPFAHAAVMMCSTATAYHALRLAAPVANKTVAILGFGGLGISALMLARALGAAQVLAVDVVDEKLALARSMGATPVRSNEDLTQSILDATGGRGADIALDLAGRADVSARAVRALVPGGTLVLVALSDAPLAVNPYRDLLARERRIIGCSDHTRAELDELMHLADTKAIDMSAAISETVPFDAAAINAVLDKLDRGTPTLRSVIAFD
jgi:2-desacetyl-2-hydroxyethyl bacteriochlorophyllide A dehydrogenase